MVIGLRSTVSFLALLLTVPLAVPALPQPAAAQAAAGRIGIDLPAQPLDRALTALADQAGLRLALRAEDVAGKTAPALKGDMSVDEALTRLLAGSGFAHRVTGSGTVTLVPAPKADGAEVLGPVTVEGARESAWGPVQGSAASRSATATKTDTPLIETPQSVSVISAARIQAIGATNVKEALSYTAGIEIAPYGSDSRFDWVSVRGFDAYTPGFYLDGLQMRNVDTWSVWRAESYGAERIEVLRGPSSVLYGQNGPGGVINVVSKRPLDEPMREVRVQVGSDSHRQLAFDATGPVDAAKTLSYRLTGVVQDAELPAGGMPNDKYFIAPAFTWKPGADTTLTVLSQFARIDAGAYTRPFPAVGSLIPTPAGTRVPSGVFTGDPDFNRLKQDQWALGYLLEHRLNDGLTLRQNARYSHIDVDYHQVNASRFIAVNGNAADPANYRVLSRRTSGSTETSQSITIDNQAQVDLHAGAWRHTLLFGLDYQRTRVDAAAYSGGRAAALDLDAPVYGAGRAFAAAPYLDGITTVVQTGLYAQDQIKLAERWAATLGARYDWADVRNDSRLDDSRTTQTNGKASYRAGLVYLHPSGLAPYVSYSESFMPSTTTDPVTGEPFAPETGRQYEAGLRYQPPGTGDSYSIALFDLKRRNYVTYDPDSMPRRTGEVTVRGVEIEAVVQPVANLNVTASYAWTPKADVTASSNPDEVGKQLNAVSRHRGSLWSDYRFASGLKLGAGVRYVGPNRGMNETAPKEVPGYALIDAMVGYDIGNWSLAVNARNLADKTYVASCAYGSCYYGEQRTVMATVSRRW
ncbi:iron complex outermembrane receptor protein [Azospirillum fermentarium]|uniref:TonB-dependent siderophore receptor n=1 Tax=Azospirillum fermentarium TaxID=1233114 RepID=UPI002226FD33|nr:TonB-dependent siderophore receptor [Azospirillum fermentarium]MCW2249065.1 iron complex outermembrane receptor protein [Azospirillum fermentarium]